MKSMFIALLTLISTTTLASGNTDNIEIKRQHQVIENAISQISPNLSVEDFTNTIEKRYYTSYRFLDKLSEKQKLAVYKFYLNEPNIDAIRHKIFGLFFEAL